MGAAEGGGDDLVLGPIGRGPGCDDGAAAHDGDGVADAEKLGQVGADEEDGLAVAGGLADAAVDGGLGSDVDAAGGLVEEEDGGLVVEEAAEGDLLLVAAAEVSDGGVGAGGLDLHGVHPEAGRGTGAAMKEPAEPREGAEAGGEEVFGDAAVEEEALALAVLAEEAHAASEALGRGLAAVGGTVPCDGAVEEVVEAEEGAEGFGAAGSDEPGDAEDFAGAQGEGCGGGLGAAPEGVELEEDGPEGLEGPWIELADVAADHEADDVLDGGVLHLAVADGFAVAKDGPAGAERLAFLKEVADVHDGDAGVGEAADDAEEVFGVHAGEAAGGFVHDEDTRAGDEGTGDLDELLPCDGEGADGGLEGDVVGAELGEGVASEVGEACAPDPAVAMRCCAEEDVFLHGKMGGEVEFLVDHGDAGAACVHGVLGLEVEAVEVDGAGVGGMGAGEDLHEGALAGAVFADQGVNLAGLDGEVDATKGLGGAESLADAGEA